MPGTYNPYTSRQHMIEGEFEIYRYQTPDVDEVALHHHDFYEIYMLLQGQVDYTVDTHLYNMQPGDIMLVGPLELHQARIFVGKETYERIVLWVSNDHLKSLSSSETDLASCFSSGRSNLLRLPGSDSAALRWQLEKLSILHASADYGSDLLAKNCLTRVMVELNRAAMNEGATGEWRSDQVVDEVVAYINDHFSEPLTLDALADRFFISKYHLLRKFDAQVGTTVHRYLLQKRLLIARQQITGGVSPSQACENCGFGDYANFYRAFRREYGLTPRQCAQTAGARQREGSPL